MTDNADLIKRLRERHPLQYGWINGEPVYHTEGIDGPSVRNRMNRCDVCEQWSPCDPRAAADTLAARDAACGHLDNQLVAKALRRLAYTIRPEWPAPRPHGYERLDLDEIAAICAATFEITE